MSERSERVRLPQDSQGTPTPLTPEVVSLARTYDTTVSTSTTVILNAATTLIEVSAKSQGIFMKWGATASSSAFDEFIQAGSTRHYWVPINTASSTQSLFSTVQFIEEAASATLIVIEK